MDVTFRPLTKRQRQELQGYVSWSATVFRAAVFLSVVGFAGWLLRAGLQRLAAVHPALAHPAWWLVPVLVSAAGLFLISRRWTGGRELRRQIAADLRRGEVAARRIVVVDAIRVEEANDEGPTFFLLTDTGTSMAFAGQYLEPYVRRGFPWAEFEILEAPESRRFLGLVKLGDRLPPSAERGPLTWDEVRELGLQSDRYRVLDRAFHALKTGA